MTIAAPTSAAHAILLAAKAAEDGESSVIATDTSGTILYWNDQATRIFGWTDEEALTQNVVDLTPTMHSTAEAGRIMDALIRGNSWSGSFLVRHRDGTPMVMAVTDVPVLYEERVVGIVGVSRRVNAAR